MNRTLRHCLPLGALALGALAATALACSTPVYRYAMYNWPVAPYGLFYLYEKEPDPADEPVHTALHRGDTETPANLTLIKVDATRQDRFDRLPPPVRKAWEDRADKKAPLHVLLNPDGVSLYTGRLKAAETDGLLDSPARQKLGKLLGKGNVVMVLLKCEDAKKNRKAEKLLDQLAKDVKAGKIELPETDDTEPSPGDPAGGPAAATPKLAVVKLVVARDDPKEQWFVRLLMSAEAGLEEFAAEPMIFPAYGRGRVLQPCLGKGITADNLAEAVYFMAGPCSCMIKDQNPGVDVLMTFDWDAAAEALATADEQSDSGPEGPGQYREVAPRGTPPAQMASAAATGPAKEDKPAKADKLAKEGNKQDKPDTAKTDAPAANEAPAVGSALRGVPEDAKSAGDPPQSAVSPVAESAVAPAPVQPLATAASPPAAGGAFVSGQLKNYAVAVLGLGVLVVALGTWWSLRKQSIR